MPGFPPSPPSRPSVRPHSRRMDGATRLALVGGAMLLAGIFAGPFVKGEFSEIGRQLRGSHAGFGPIWGMRLDETQQADVEDRRGEHRGRGGDMADQLGPPERTRWSEARGEALPETSGAPPRQQESRDPPPPRWRDCGLGSIWDDRLNCGPWHAGALPRRGR